MTDDVTVELIVLTVPTVRSGVEWVTGLGHISVVGHVTGGDASRIRHHPPSKTSQSRLRSARNTCGGRDSCESHSTQPDPRKRKTTIKSRSLQVGSARPNRDPQMPKRMDQTQTKPYRPASYLHHRYYPPQLVAQACSMRLLNRLDTLSLSPHKPKYC